MGDQLGNATAKVFRRTRGEAIDVATSAGLVVRVCVLDVDREKERVTLVLVAAPEVRFEALTRVEAERRARRASMRTRQEAYDARRRGRA